MNGETSNTNHRMLGDASKWVSNQLPAFNTIYKVEMLIFKNNSLLYGIRMYNSSGQVIFTTGNYIESDNLRNDKGFQL